MPSEHELRQFLRSRGIVDINYVQGAHPRSKELRDAGFNEHADILDSYYQRVEGGEIKIMTLAEVEAKVKEIQDAERNTKASPNHGGSGPRPGVREKGGYTTVRGERVQPGGQKDRDSSEEEEGFRRRV